MRRLWELSNVVSCLTISTYDFSWGRKLIILSDRLPNWLRKFSLAITFIFGLTTYYLCARFIIDAPLLLTLAQSACFLPVYVRIFWSALAFSWEELRKISAPGLVFRISLFLIIVGSGALSFASNMYRGVAAELEFRDATGASKDLIQAMHLQANKLESLALDWAIYGFWIGMLFLLFFGVIWVWRSYREIASIMESPKLDKDEVFVVGDRG